MKDKLRANLKIMQITNCPYCGRVNTVKAISPELTKCDGCKKEYDVQPYEEIRDVEELYTIKLVESDKEKIFEYSLMSWEYETLYYVFKDWNKRLGKPKFSIKKGGQIEN